MCAGSTNDTAVPYVTGLHTLKQETDLTNRKAYFIAEIWVFTGGEPIMDKIQTSRSKSVQRMTASPQDYAWLTIYAHHGMPPPHHT